MTKVRKKIGTIPINDIEQQVQQSTQAAVTQMQQDVQEFINEETAQYPEIGGAFKFKEDPERRSEITTDSEGKIISYRDVNGVKHEGIGFESNRVSTNSLTLSSEGMTEFQKALKDSGFKPGSFGDWSDYISNDGANPLCLSEPRCAMMNIISDVDLSSLKKKGMSGAQKGVNYKVPCQVEWYDMQGNYFKKWVEMSGQGNSSMMFPQKNIAMDFFDDETMDGAFKLKIGNWVSQDSYHFKAFYSDYLKGAGIIAYKIAMQAQNTRGIFEDISWKKALIDKDSISENPYMAENEISDFSLQMNDARCMPDGFPIMVYQNGEFYGIYTQCLKKHRDNYHMNKSTAEHIHLDGDITNASIFEGTVDWTAFEVRNPKDLYYKEAHNGTYKYDADDPGQFEIADQATVDTWIAAGQFPDGTAITSKISKQLKTTAKVHKYIDDLAATWAAINAGSTDAEKKELFETYYDADGIIDYILINMALKDTDGFGPNWQWTTWDGVKWYVNEYDKDNSFGNNSKGFIISDVPNPSYWFGSSVAPTKFVIDNYTPELKARWTELVAADILTTDNFMRVINEWVSRVGYDNYKRHYLEKWAESPCCRDAGISPKWEYVSTVRSFDPGNYDDTHVYMAGDTCTLQLEVNIITFRCKEDNTVGVFPCKVYSTRPVYMGFYDNIWRYEKYIKKNLNLINNFISQI